ncbi:GNAT family N-acetyltransferase [Streptomyces aurantiogriseus]|uniref:N-acetyltransferase domain-containing protein n=1 Tax=Streptomyces aurantiogriseus TaxID=66870 RepID=A0A918FJA1_9ACTN|nr:GNAT family N-acetyltransferase [Streptomyces aurantiogriseus]GGR42132.1 hypothetical protein GCM10010251_68900 [Streptomyces aurantiogriseus]
MTTHDLAITTATADDPRIRRLVRALDDDLAARYPDEPCAGGAHLHPAIRFLLAETDDRPVGCCALQPFPAPATAAELKRMYVAPEARGRGIAARLLAEAERTAAALGHTEIRLETGIHQPEAIALYTRAGYRPIPNYPPYEHKTLSRCYAKPLAPPTRARAEQDGDELTAFLAGQGLSSHGVLATGTRYWITRDTNGPAVALGLEGQGDHLLLRSVAVRPDLRGCGAARRLVEHVLADASARGACTAYLFSTGAGAFWTRLGFRPVPVAEAAAALPEAPQVHHYRATGALADEAAWRRDLHARAAARTDRPADDGGATAAPSAGR